jgi:hypothetical protein
MYARRVRGYLDEQGNYEVIVSVSDKFLGVYAGTIDQLNEDGRVWKTSALMEIYDSLAPDAPAH